MRTIFIASFLVNFHFLFSQQNLISTHSFYRDHLFWIHNDSYITDNQTIYKTTYFRNSFLPTTENRYNLNDYLKDTSIQYYDFAEILFKKHLVEVKSKDCFLTISPLVDVSLGRDLKDTSSINLFQNTRGVLIEGDLFKNFSFSTSFFENQSRLSAYEQLFINERGEFRPTSVGYAQENGVISGATRTKPFKTNGYDYAYAIGNIIYSPHKKIDLIAGNNQQFIGTGYRSMLLSDNSSYSPYFRIDYYISNKISFNYLRSRSMNLIRKKVFTTVEGFYQPKGLGVNYLTFHFSNKVNLSLFDGTIWSMGDSLQTKAVNPLYYNPIPFISTLFNDSTTYAIQGLNLNWIISNKIRTYGQFAIGNLDINQLAYQIGVRAYDLFMKNSMLQLEFNSADEKMYQSKFSRLNYSNHNLPLAHTKGSGFKELILRFNWEFQRCYIDLKSISYYLENFNRTALLPIPKNNITPDGFLFHNQLELGYRFNKKINLTIFANAIYRYDDTSKNQNVIVSTGIRTALINHYNDY
jgi:hypothetical protein